MENQISTNLKGKLQAGKPLKRYKVMHPEGNQPGMLEIDPLTAASRAKVLAPLALMLAHASGREGLNDGEFQLLATALEKFKVTADEVFTAFWKAYADPYVSQGKIEFRHLWKHIEAERNKEPEPQYFQRL